MQTLRFGLIGCGGIGKLHALNLRHLPGAEVVAYADVRGEAAESFLRDFGGAPGAYASHNPQELFDDPRLDAVLLATGERHHPRLAIAAARAGKHVLCEKPIAVTVEDALEVERVVRETGIKFQIGLCNRLAPMVQRAKTMLPHPRITFGQCSDKVADQAVHNLDLIVHVFHESPLQSVYATGGHFYGLDAHLPADHFIATLKFEDGSQACYIQHGTAYQAPMGKYSFQLFGRDRGVFLARRFKEVHLSTNVQAPALSYAFSGPDFTPANAEAHDLDSRGPHGYMGHYDELATFCDAVRRDVEPPMTVEEARHVLQVEKAVFESLQTNQVVNFPQFLARWNSSSPRRHP